MTQKEKDALLSPEEIEVNAVLETANKRIEELQNQIDNPLPPKDNGPSLRPNGAPPPIQRTPAMMAAEKTGFNSGKKISSRRPVKKLTRHFRRPA